MHFARQLWNPCSKKTVRAFRQEGHKKRELRFEMWADNSGFPHIFSQFRKTLPGIGKISRKFLTIK